MGDTAVDIFQETLKELITSSRLSLIIEEKHQLQSLEDEIKYLRVFLKDMEKKRNNHPEVMKLVMQIRDLVSEAENIVELFVVHAFKADQVPYSLREHQDHLCLDLGTIMKWMKNIVVHAFQPYHLPYSLHEHQDHLSLDLGTIKKGMKTLTTEVKKIYKKNMYDINGGAVKQLKHSSTESGGGTSSSRRSNTSKVVKEEVVVGFEEKVTRLLDKLDDRGEDRPLMIISIIGAGGGGKTTLAKEVYYHPFTLYTFGIRVWINVSQDYDKTRKRDLLICVLESVKPGKNAYYDADYGKCTDDKLGEEVFGCLKGRKFLIVMDDIWGIEAWNDIQRSFPKECKGSKVLFTSRQLVQPNNVGYFPHYLAQLPDNCCWELLQKKVFGMKCCPPNLVDIGEQIAKKCKGLPLAVVTIAGILATENKTRNMWEKVAKHLSSIIAKNPEAGCMDILELSYNHLPFHLKACFLYIGGYPENKEILVRELIWLWIAEGFIQQSEARESLETIAKGYLISLIDRSLVQVARKSPLGGIKACHIHDLLRELCLKKAEDDNFLVKVYEEDSCSPSATNNHRRLFIGRKFFEKFPLRPRNLRSFMCLREINEHRFRVGRGQPEVKLSFFAENFELLRVLSFVSGQCQGEIGIGQLVHLRYLAIMLNHSYCDLPFSCLLNLKILNLLVSVSDWKIKLPCNIFNMVKLRHLYIKKGFFTFHHASEEAGSNSFDRSSKLDSLQTLYKICACEACRSFLVRTPNLRKLGFCGGLMPKYQVMRFPDLEFLKCLETLTFTFFLESMGTCTLPPELKLPPTITRVTLKKTHLQWKELSILQTLPSLEVLKLITDACCGPVWDISDMNGFPQLKYLRFFSLNIKKWHASEEQFPKLEILKLEDCRILEQIPIDFGNLNELREIKLDWCRRSVVESAKEILEEQRNRNGDDDCLNLVAKHTLEVITKGF